MIENENKILFLNSLIKKKNVFYKTIREKNPSKKVTENIGWENFHSKIGHKERKSKNFKLQYWYIFLL